MDKSADAFRTISEAAEELHLPQHVLRFWETRFPQIKPLKRAGGRRYYRPRDIELLRLIKRLLYGEGYTIKGVQRVFNEQGVGALAVVREAMADKSVALSLPPEQGTQGLENSPPWQIACAGAVTGHSTRGQPPPDLSDPPDLGHFSKTFPRKKGVPALPADGVLRLQAALAELAECEAILEGARRA
jgi:DNA-binding transcriptional MerR regulator